MKTKSKALLLSMCAVLLVVASVFGTLAYLTDKDSVTNTFTVGKVDINLDEKDINATGESSRTETGNEYHLLPGHTYEKDPTVTVLSGSEKSYVRILMTVHNASAVDAIIKADDKDGNEGAIVDYADLFSEWDPNVWKYEGFSTSTENTITFEFRYAGIVEGKVNGTEGNVRLPALFTHLVVPEYVTNEQLVALYGTSTDETDDFKIEIVAHAIQAEGFTADTTQNMTAEDAAWKAFDEQYKK